MSAFRIKDIKKKAVKAGWRVNSTKNGHYCFLSPNRETNPIYVSSTPSDFRAIYKIKAQFKRNGLDLDY